MYKRQRQHRLHLGVLRVVDTARDAWGEVGFDVPDPGDRFDADTGRFLACGERAECREVLGGARDDQAALVFELEGVRSEFPAGLVPQGAAQARQGEFGAGFLVGEEHVALAAARRAGADGASVDDRDVQARGGRVEGTGGPDDARAHDDDLQGHRPPQCNVT